LPGLFLRAIGSANIVATGFNPLKNRRRNVSAVGTTYILPLVSPVARTIYPVDQRLLASNYMGRGYASLNNLSFIFNGLKSVATVFVEATPLWRFTLFPKIHYRIEFLFFAHW